MTSNFFSPESRDTIKKRINFLSKDKAIYIYLYIHKDVHCTTICNSEKLETANF